MLVPDLILTVPKFGVYTKIGNTVHFQGEIALSGITSAGTGNLLIRGLPFNANIQYYGVMNWLLYKFCEWLLS